MPGRSGWPSRDPIQESGGENLYEFASNDPENEIELLGLIPAECERHRFEFELGKWMKWTVGKGESKVADTWLRAEYSKCSKCCNGGLKYRYKWDVAGGASGVAGPKIRPFAEIGFPFLYGQVVVSGGGSITLAREACPSSFTGGGCFNFQIGLRFGLDDGLGGSLIGDRFQVYGEGGGGARLCLLANSRQDNAKITLQVQAYARAVIKIRIYKRLSYSYMWQNQWSTGDNDIFDF